MEMGVLFDYLDRVERRERPLTPIRAHLESSPKYVGTDATCSYDDCSGKLWELVTGERLGESPKVCGTCSSVTDQTRRRTLSDDLYNEWEEFMIDRPRYRGSNRKRQPGSFDHEWVESDDIDGTVLDLNPTLFYRPDDEK